MERTDFNRKTYTVLCIFVLSQYKRRFGHKTYENTWRVCVSQWNWVASHRWHNMISLAKLVLRIIHGQLEKQMARKQLSSFNFSLLLQTAAAAAESQECRTSRPLISAVFRRGAAHYRVTSWTRKYVYFCCLFHLVRGQRQETQKYCGKLFALNCRHPKMPSFEVGEEVAAEVRKKRAGQCQAGFGWAQGILLSKFVLETKRARTLFPVGNPLPGCPNKRIRVRPFGKPAAPLPFTKTAKKLYFYLE